MKRVLLVCVSLLTLTACTGAATVRWTSSGRVTVHVMAALSP
jgi:hypothetical protein